MKQQYQDAGVDCLNKPHAVIASVWSDDNNVCKG